MNPKPALTMAALLLAAAGTAQADPLTLSVHVGPDSGSAAQSCDPPAGGSSGSTTQLFSTTCSRSDVGTASGTGIAAAGHVGASAQAGSHNGNSLGVNIGAQGLYDDFLVFTSSDPTQTTALVSLNLLLQGTMSAGTSLDGGGANASLRAFTILGSTGFELRMDVAGGISLDDYQLDSGSLGPLTDAHLHTGALTVPLNSPVHLRLDLEVGAGASGPGSLALADFAASSFRFADGDVFTLPAGVTVNAGSYLVDNRFIDPLLPVPEPAGWALLLAGLSVVLLLRARQRG
ncbi:PEP-CTERM sorting domain-containing protein [Aquabacterium sp.]|uniref:PEP-CTERM sorting domain-containing protein n=1 Tax=Aquabacterium sp. TaxID=1872578 RepID=UPI003783D0A2